MDTHGHQHSAPGTVAATAADAMTSNSRTGFSSTVTVTAVLFFLCLLPFEMIPEIPVDIDSKPFFVPLALCALLPRRMGLAIGLGVALGEGMRDLMEGYELDDPIGFFGYVAGFWSASQIYALAPRNIFILIIGAIVCGFVQAAIEASSFLLFGAEGWIVTVESALGNTVTHGIIWGAFPLLFLVPALRGKFERNLGFAPVGMKPPSPLVAIDCDFLSTADAIASASCVTYRGPGDDHPLFENFSCALRPGECVHIVSPDPEPANVAGLVVAGLAPRVVGGDMSGAVHSPVSVAVLGSDPRDLATQARAVEEVAAAMLLDGGDPTTALQEARALLNGVGLSDREQQAFIWTLSMDLQYRVQIAAARALRPTLLLVHRPPAFGLSEQSIGALADLIQFQRSRGAVLVSDTHHGLLAGFADRKIDLTNDAAETVSAPKIAAEPVVPGPVRDNEDDRGVHVITLQTGRDGWWRRRDPRVKWAMFAALIVLIYVAPTWQWMAVMTAVGLIMTVMARPPLFWLGLAIFVQAPNILGLIFLPLLGGGDFNEEIAFGLRLGLGWLAAIFFGISLLSTMDVPELIAGLRGLGLPKRFSAMIGQVFVMIYLSIADLARISRGARQDLRHFVRRPMVTITGFARLFVPGIVSVTRRSAAMAIALDTRRDGLGVPPYATRSLDPFDIALMTLTIITLIAAIIARSGVF